MPRNKKIDTKSSDDKEVKVVSQDTTTTDVSDDTSTTDVLSETEFEIIFDKCESELYYDLILVYHNDKYYMSVDDKFYQSLPKMFRDYPEIVKTKINKHQKNLDFFDIKIDDKKIICSFEIDLEFIKQKIDLVFAKPDFEQLNLKLIEAKDEIKQLKDKIDSIEEKEWIVYDYEFDSDEERKFKEFANIEFNAITYAKKNIYTNIDISESDKTLFEKIKTKYTADKFYAAGIPFYSLKRRRNITLIKKNDLFHLTGDIISDHFNNILKIPKGLLKSKNILLSTIRYELIYGKPQKYRDGITKVAKLNTTTEVRVEKPILPEIYIKLKKIEDDDDDDYDKYQFCMTDNGVDPSEFNKGVLNDTFFNNIKENGVISYFNSYLKSSINYEFTDKFFF
jgi:hypothetical protein